MFGTSKPSGRTNGPLNLMPARFTTIPWCGLIRRSRLWSSARRRTYITGSCWPTAKAHKHLFVEKPLGMNGSECREMAGAIEQARVLFATGYGMRTQPAHLFLKEQVAQGTFGKITRVRASVCHDGSLGRIFDTEWRWMADPKVAGCGGFGDLGTHGLDLLMWLVGGVEQVVADIKVVTGRYYGGTK